MLPKLLLYVVLGASTLALQIGFGRPIAELLFAPQWLGSAVWLDIALGLLMGFCLVALSRFSASRFSWTKRLDLEFRTVLGPLNGGQIFALATLSSVTEELFFRGFLQSVIGLEWAALVFGLAHFPYRKFLIPWTITAIAVGWLFGYVFEHRSCLIAPIVAHFVVNYFNLHFILRPRADAPIYGKKPTRNRNFSSPHGAKWDDIDH
tara:strand:- start:59 stop:676 length:618 start_codon:yes stop_codon:yes gene_type:complete